MWLYEVSRWLCWWLCWGESVERLTSVVWQLTNEADSDRPVLSYRVNLKYWAQVVRLGVKHLLPAGPTYQPRVLKCVSYFFHSQCFLAAMRHAACFRSAGLMSSLAINWTAMELGSHHALKPLRLWTSSFLLCIVFSGVLSRGHRAERHNQYLIFFLPDWGCSCE